MDGMGYPQSIYLRLEQKNCRFRGVNQPKKGAAWNHRSCRRLPRKFNGKKTWKKLPSKRKRHLQKLKPPIFRFHVSALLFFNHEISLGFPHQLPPQISDFPRLSPWPWRTTEKHGTVGRPGARQSRLRAAGKRGMRCGHALFSKNRSYQLVCVYLGPK